MRSATCGKTMYSVMFCANATGQFLPPFTIYKGIHLYQSWTSGGPPGAQFGVTKSGWMEDVVFESWFGKVFVEHVKDIESRSFFFSMVMDLTLPTIPSRLLWITQSSSCVFLQIHHMLSSHWMWSYSSQSKLHGRTY